MSFQTIELNNNIIKRKEYNNISLEPILELYKGKLYCYLINSFINDCVNTFGYQIFSIKKSHTLLLIKQSSSSLTENSVFEEVAILILSK